MAFKSKEVKSPLPRLMLAGETQLGASHRDSSLIQVRIGTDGFLDILAPRKPLPHSLVFRLISVVYVATLCHKTLERACISQLGTLMIGKSSHNGQVYSGQSGFIYAAV